MIKKIFSVILCIGMLISNVVYANDEEGTENLNISSEDVKKIMKNTVMLQDGSNVAFAFGKRVNLEESAYSEESGTYVLSSFLKESFPGSDVGENKFSEIFAFASSAGR